MINGITITLYNKVQTGTDDFNRPIYEEQSYQVDNVLVSPSSNDDIVEQLNLTGKKAIYTLAIPKGDNHIWQDQYVEFFGKRWHVFTMPIMGIEENIPLKWNAKVMVEHYEQ